MSHKACLIEFYDSSVRFKKLPLLEDMFLGFTVPAFTKSIRKNILSSGRFYMCDLGIRHAAAGLTPSLDTVRADPGPLFEQWVGIELWKRLHYLGTGELYYQMFQ